ncbi:MAG: hypothetical protein QOE45_111 [Frankiaceae bacterium]|jgi:hypothetical protein|nr:hypothetical protein [Frankiaceae bacterium]
MAAAQPARDLWTAISAVDDALTEAVKRVSRRSPQWWAGEAGGATRADHVARLVATLAAAGQQAEGRPAPHHVPQRPARNAVLADQLAVVGRDLVAALRATKDTDGAREALGQITDCLDAVDPTA